MEPNVKRPKRVVYVIYGEGWLWNGLGPWVSSTAPDRIAGITFPSRRAALSIVAQLRRFGAAKRFRVDRA